MTAHRASLINAITLLFCSGWGYWATDFKSLTALIPAVFGVALLLCYKGVREHNKLIAHVAAVLTVVLLIALYMPLTSALEMPAFGPVLRALLMVLTTAFALLYFIKSFRDARRAR